MARPRKTVEQTWYDIFMAADLSEQVIMLRMLEQLHYQARAGKIGKNAQNKLSLAESAAAIEEDA